VTLALAVAAAATALQRPPLVLGGSLVSGSTT